MLIQLTPDQENIIRNQLQTGQYENAEEILETALQLLSKYQSGEADADETTEPLIDSIDLRKSSVSLKKIIGNSNKYESYREAWSRIKQAQENQFFLEAITIQESIISDRLISFLTNSKVKKPLSKNKYGNWPSFGNLIQHWRSESPEGVKYGKSPDQIDLIEAVDQWRNNRNDAIHAIAKSDPGEPTQDIDIFLQQAQEVAERGEYLAKAICSWHKGQKKLQLQN
jgi:Arc/MetJ-type ribon-helix-helix transcriptional regulator